MTDEALEELARFLPALEKSDFKAGEIRGGDQIEPGVFSMPYVHYSDTVSTFVDAAYRYNWVSSDFDWLAWTQSTEAAQLRPVPAREQASKTSIGFSLAAVFAAAAACAGRCSRRAGLPAGERVR